MSDHKFNIWKNSHSRGSDNRQPENDFKTSTFSSFIVIKGQGHIRETRIVTLDKRTNNR